MGPSARTYARFLGGPPPVNAMDWMRQVAVQPSVFVGVLDANKRVTFVAKTRWAMIYGISYVIGDGKFAFVRLSTSTASPEPNVIPNTNDPAVFFCKDQDNGETLFPVGDYLPGGQTAVIMAEFPQSAAGATVTMIISHDCQPNCSTPAYGQQ